MQDIAVKNIGTLMAGEGEVLDVFGATMVVRADPAELGLFLGEHVVPPGFFVPPHVHAEEDEVFHILDGDLTLLDAEGERRVGPGATVHLPAGSRHGYRNETTSPTRFLVMIRPGLQGLEMFRHFDRAGRALPSGLTPREIIGICAQYGVAMG